MVVACWWLCASDVFHVCCCVLVAAVGLLPYFGVVFHSIAGAYIMNCSTDYGQGVLLTVVEMVCVCVRVCMCVCVCVCVCMWCC